MKERPGCLLFILSRLSGRIILNTAPATAVPFICNDKAFLFYFLVYEASPLKLYITKFCLRYALSNERKYLTTDCDEVEKCQALFQNDLFETADIYSHALLIRENLYDNINKYCILQVKIYSGVTGT
jgi:hypothetical protein